MPDIQTKLTEFSDLITHYTADFVGREWLVKQVNALLDDPACRFVVLTGGPGVGKTAFLAHLAATYPHWPRYFIRRDSRDLLSPGDGKTFLLTIGGQLATLYPHLFHPENLEVVVRQRIRDVAAGGEVVGARIDELRASPFYSVALRVEQEIRQVQGKATALEIARLVSEPRLLGMQDLQYLGLLDPVRLLAQIAPEVQIAVLVDALDELRYSPAEPDILRALRELPEIPPNLRFVISSRPEAFLDLLLARGDVRELPLDVAAADNWTDLWIYTESAFANDGLGLALAEEKLRPEEFVDGLLEKAAGNFLYLKSVLDGIKEALADPAKQDRLHRLLRVEELPDDLGALYGYFLASIVDWAERRGFGDRLWRRFLRAILRRVWGRRLWLGSEAAWRKYLSPLLGALAVAQEPLSEEQLVAFTGLNPSDIRGLLRELRQFVESVDNALVTYRIYHASFAEYLLDSQRSYDYWVDGQEIHQRIASYYLADQAHWKEHHGYAFRHLSAHLAQAWMWDNLYALIEDHNWHVAQHDYNLASRFYRADILRATTYAVDQGIDGLPRVLAYGLLLGTLTTWSYKRLTLERVKQMIEAREVDSILEWADTFPEGHWFKIDLIQLAGEVAALAGQKEKAVNELRRAANKVPGIAHNLFNWSKYLRSIAVDLAVLDDNEGIALLLSIAEQIPEQMVDHFFGGKATTIEALRKVQEHLGQGNPDSAFMTQALGFQQYPAVELLTREGYMRVPAEEFLYAVGESARAWAAWADVLYQSEDSERARLAFEAAKSASNLIDPHDQHGESRSRALGRLAEVAATLGRPKDEVERLLNEAIATARQSDYYIIRIGVQVFLANLSVKLAYIEQAKQLLRDIFGQFDLERPMGLNKAIWLSELAPCVELFPEPDAILRNYLQEESLRDIVDLIWKAYFEDIDAAENLLASMDRIPDQHAGNPYLIHRSFRAMIPLLKKQPEHHRLLENALEVSQRILPASFWLPWLGELLAAVRVDENIATDLMSRLEDMYNRAAPDSRAELALYMSLPLAFLPIAGQIWVPSIIHRVFHQQTPYQRAFALDGVERFAPLVLALGGAQVAVETWERIQAVERLFR